MNKLFLKRILPFYFCLLLVVVSGWQLLGQSVDYTGYQRIFQFGFGERNPTEPFFSLLRMINDVLFHSSLIPVYFISAVLALTFKWKAFSYLADNNVLLVFVLNCLAFFLIHEYTQIRASCSIGAFLLVLCNIYQKKKSGIFFWTFVAVCFHYSAAFILFFLIFIKVANTKMKLALLPLFGFCFALFADSAFASSIRNFIYLVESTAGLQKSGNVSGFMSPLNAKYLMLLILFLFYLMFLPKTDKKNMLLAKSMSFGLCFYYWLNPVHLPVISVRMAEFYTSVFVLLFMNASKYLPIKEKRILLLLPVLSVFLYGTATFNTFFPE